MHVGLHNIDDYTDRQAVRLTGSGSMGTKFSLIFIPLTICLDSEIGLIFNINTNRFTFIGRILNFKLIIKQMLYLIGRFSLLKWNNFQVFRWLLIC